MESFSLRCVIWHHPTTAARNNTDTVNTTTDKAAGNSSYTYDPLNRLQTAAGPTGHLSYTIDAFGNKYQQTVTSGTGPSPQGYQVAANNALTAQDTPDPNVTTATATQLRITDQVGSLRGLLDLGEQVVQSCTSFPFGDGATCSSPADQFFSGKKRDAETTLDYFGARYYNSTLGRWTPTAAPNTANPNPDDKSGAKDKRWTKNEIKNLKHNTNTSAEEIKTDALGTKRVGPHDLFKNADGDIIAKPKDSSGTGEPTGYTTEQLKP